MDFIDKVIESIQILSTSNIDWSMGAGAIWFVCGTLLTAALSVIYVYFGDE